MSKKQRGMLVVFIFVLSTMLISACTQSLSSAPAATPTLLPDGLFVSPFPSVENPMAMIEEFAKQTAAAQTTVANGGTPVTPGAVVTATTPLAVTTGTVITPQSDVIATATATAIVISTPTNAIAQPAATSVPPGVRPASYTLQSGEFPYCIARRFNVDPDELLSLSGLSSAQANSLSAGTVLKIPQSGAFPGDRALAAHPTTYSVVSSDETIYGVACKFGDIDPNAIASANGISASASLTAGQQLKIP
ncbi:MAG: LysM peptidoglycan-binding domain-containing protein [Anaerolineales bacterium]